MYAEMKQHCSTAAAAAAVAAAWDDGYSIKYDLSGCEMLGTSLASGVSVGGGVGGVCSSSLGGVSGGGGNIGGIGALRNKSPLNSSIGSRISSLNNSHR